MQQIVVLPSLGSMTALRMEKSLKLYADKVAPRIAYLRDKETTRV